MYGEVIVVSWLGLISVVFVIAGIGLFLYGANIYNATIGWTGFGLGVVGILLYVATFFYVQLRKKEPERALL